MRRSVDLAVKGICFATAVLLSAGLTMPALAQQEQISQPDRISVQDRVQQDQTLQQDQITLQERISEQNKVQDQPLQRDSTAEQVQIHKQNQTYTGGVVDDWSSHHVIFSNPGTMEDAIRDGTYENWQRIVTDPRYRMQWIKRYGARAVQATVDSYRFPRFPHDPIEPGPPRYPRNPNPPHHEPAGPILGPGQDDSLQGMWTVSLSGGGPGSASDKFPAKFTFSPIYGADCVHDYVAFPIVKAGSSLNQANILGVNNLYAGTCTTGTVPTVLFAYYVGTGSLQTSLVLSENGAKIAFVESITGNGTSTGSKFHVLTVGTGGNGGCPSSNPCNGTAFSPPVQPGTVNGSTVNTLNNAVDNSLVMSGFVSNTRSSPFVDYTHDIAYVGDDNGKLHKFTPVFTGTPVEAGSPWPVTVAPAGTILTAPIFDGGTSQNIYVGGSNGVFYCVKAAGTTCGSVTVGTGPVVDAAVVDLTYEKAYVEANNTTTGHAVLTQLPISATGFGTAVSANVGFASSAANGTMDLYAGAFNNAYNTTGTGYIYFCGTGSTAAYSTLYRVAITNGVMANANDGNSFSLESSSNGNPAGTTNDCSPITEYYNTTTSTDWLFLGVEGNGSAVCGLGVQCVMSFNITSGFPTAIAAKNSTSINQNGVSGIIIDNPSGGGGSQIYFGNIGPGYGEQLSQNGLK